SVSRGAVITTIFTTLAAVSRSRLSSAAPCNARCSVPLAAELVPRSPHAPPAASQAEMAGARRLADAAIPLADAKEDHDRRDGPEGARPDAGA
ncbi:MAG TPA: hypothetical protein VHI11_04045, partial [Jiangellaceae bacterium]|nr:hypothetical protein [Jiangellaceae bacterium]